MGLLTSLRKALTADPSVVETIHSRRNTLIPSLGGTNRASAQIKAAFATAQSANYAWMYAQSPAVRTVVDLIARNVGQLDLRLYEEIDESNREARPDHNAALSLANPSPTQTRDQFVRAVMQDFLVFNNAYALKFRDRGTGLVILKPIPAHRVEILGQGLFDPEGYKVHRTDGTFVVVEDPTDMIHWRGWNPEDPRIGLSPLETLRNVVAEDAALQATIVELMKSGLAGPSWVSRPLEAPDWSNEALAGFEEHLANRLRKASSRPPVFEEGMQLHSTGVSPRDAEMLAVRKWAIQQVCSLYGVHPASCGLDGNIEEAQKVLYSDVLPPYCEQFTRTLDLSLLKDEYGESDYCFEFNLDEKHMGDDRLKSLTSATGRPVLTTNEGRAMVNRPPIKGGDELVTPQNVIVGENPKPSPQTMPIQDPNKPDQDGSYREEPKALTNGHKQLEEIPQLHPGFKAELDRQHRNIDMAQAVVERHFNRLGRSLKQKKAAVDWDRFNREFGDDLHPVVEHIVEKEGTIYGFKLAGGFDMGRVQKYVRAMAEGAAIAINDKVREEIDAFGVEGALARKAQHVESAGAGIGSRATLWAREEAARQSPLPERRVKTWIANTKRHAQWSGTTIPLGDEWPAGFAPGRAPGCKCSMSIE